MKILSIDTSSPIGSVSLIKDNKIVASRSWNSPREHSVKLFENLQHIVGTAENKFSDIDIAIFTAGPGSFTGIRIGLSVARAFKLSGKLKEVGTVSTVEAFSYCFLKDGFPVFVIVEGRKNRYYTYCRDETSVIFPIEDLTLKEIKERLEKLTSKVTVTGYFSENSEIVEFLKHQNNIFIKKACSSISICAALYAQKFGYRTDLEPIYIRQPDAKPKNKNLE
ncbi:tRNA (adenosine(37)-N6)-threonylcarbamoyltransferase complex dimerization subunit type 1 TsaB [Desulfurobacterium atlanticum]|uniref:tRNA threonylcarbamoyl adenosine modification protein YeaZ n=1 Tax=Desulfurobacterium atlanticum TaxID=240169 RepID=A0A238XZL9_9BACT|nr:tRNA (adenosine(37)-N6)-threonylcarbamoyltransferase complex dimerization subunit type 1 TsaB [Desulfurobacterium atlanticum]SNR64435.1 tRNA threonylcarbamoyl adenosine modification protein YeaZ [Desulfurobacterium atlanticum]